MKKVTGFFNKHLATCILIVLISGSFASYIISMDSESKTLNIICSGTVEQNDVKKEICDVMEGGEKAFKYRANFYGI